MKEIIQALFETAIESGVNRYQLGALRNTLSIVDPTFDQSPIMAYYEQQSGGHSDYAQS